MIKKDIVFVLFIVLLWGTDAQDCTEEELVDCSAYGVSQFCPQTFVNSLYPLFTSTNGDSWNFNDNWLSTATDACQPPFAGLTCEGSCPISLSLNLNQLEGPLPTFTYLLPLTSISLNNNALSGDSSPIVSFEGLTDVDLSYNSFNQAIPPVATTIENLNLQNSGFIGPLPQFDSTLSLQTLIISNNSIEDTIEDNFATPSLTYIDASSNDFTGTLPTALFSPAVPTTYQYVSFSDNSLTEIPPISGLATFLTLDLSENDFNIPIPPNLYANDTLNLEDNYFGPYIPESFSGITNLQLSNNLFTDPFPDFLLTQPPNANTIYLNNNDFLCPLPQWCSTLFGDGHCEPCEVLCTNITGLNVLPLENCNINLLKQNPTYPVYASNISDSEFVTNVFGGSYTKFINLVPNTFYYFSTCQLGSHSDGFDSVLILKDPEQNVIGSNDDCTLCDVDGGSYLLYYHPFNATYSSVTLSVFVYPNTIPSCLTSVGDKRKRPLYQGIYPGQPTPTCSNYSISCLEEYSILLTPTQNEITLVPADIDNGSETCSFALSINQTEFGCDQRGVNYVELSFYDFTCVTQVTVTTTPPIYECADTYIVIQQSDECTPTGCSMNIYTFDIDYDLTSACQPDETALPEFPYFGYIGDNVQYHTIFTDRLFGVANVACPITLYGMRIINIIDETFIGNENPTFSISVDYSLPSGYGAIVPFAFPVTEFDPKSGDIPDTENGVQLSYHLIEYRTGGLTFVNMILTSVPVGNYYLLTLAQSGPSFPYDYVSIGNPVVYFISGTTYPYGVGSGFPDI